MRSPFFGVVGSDVVGAVPRIEIALRRSGSPYFPAHAVGPRLAFVAEHWSQRPQEPWAYAGRLIGRGDDARAPDPGRGTRFCRELERIDDALKPEPPDGCYAAVRVLPEACTAILVRDPFGLRPLFYHVQGNRLWFADDVRMLRTALDSTRVRIPALLEFAHYGAPLAPASYFDGIQVVPNGHAIVFDWTRGTVETLRHFDPAASVDPDRYRGLATQPVKALEAELEQRLDGAVAHAIAGEPRVSILVSGGVDSSAIAAMAVRHAEVDAVTVALEGPGVQSELPHAKRVADHLGIRLHDHRFGPQEFRTGLVDAIARLGSPVIIGNAVALHHVAESGALPSGQLVLDGEGADALFFGSTPLFKHSMVTMLARRLTGIRTPAIRHAFERTRARLDWLGLQTRSTMDAGGVHWLLGARGMELDQLSHRLLRAFSHVEDEAEREVCMLALREFYDYLVPLMARIDTMARTANTHAVLPFLEREFFGFATNLPMQHKIRTRRGRPLTKWLLKRVAARHLPPDVIYRPKDGFGVPMGRWVGPMPERWCNEAWVCEAFGIARGALVDWLARDTGSPDRMFVSAIEIWGRIFDWGVPVAQVREEWIEASLD